MKIDSKKMQKIFWKTSPPDHLDIILIFGSTRIDWSDIIEKIQLKQYNYIIVTGKYTDYANEKNIITQSEFIAQQLINSGVSPSKILLEKKATNTLENVLFSRKKLGTKYIPKNICFISKSYHSLRCMLTLKKIFGDIPYFCINYDAIINGKPITEKNWTKNKETYLKVEKEYKKILTYGSKGDIVFFDFEND